MNFQDYSLEKIGIEPTTSWLPVINISLSLLREDTENIGIMELYVIPNVCSEYSEQKIQANGRSCRAINHSTWSGSSIRFTFDLFSRMSTRKSLDAQHQGFFYGQTCACTMFGAKNSQERFAFSLSLSCQATLYRSANPCGVTTIVFAYKRHKKNQHNRWFSVLNRETLTARPKTFWYNGKCAKIST